MMMNDRIEMKTIVTNARRTRLIRYAAICRQPLASSAASKPSAASCLEIELLGPRVAGRLARRTARHVVRHVAHVVLLQDDAEDRRRQPDRSDHPYVFGHQLVDVLPKRLPL